MKKVIRFFGMSVVGMLAMAGAIAQNKIDEARMERDLEVAENILGTVIKQQFDKRSFFPMEVQGTYTQGYGVTFRLPMEELQWAFSGDEPMSFMLAAPRNRSERTYTYSYSRNGETEDIKGDEDCEGCPVKVRVNPRNEKSRQAAEDSARTNYNLKVIQAAKDFLADYGDLISQLAPEEKIMITNRGENQRFWLGSTKRSLVKIEAIKSDITQFKQGKLTRDQLMGKFNVVNSETMDDLYPDLELLSSIFDRLYRSDLSRTYFIGEGTYYERLKDFGVVYYMQVYSGNVLNGSRDNRRYSMPTIGLDDVDEATRNKKAIELYPIFEKEIKDNLIEYGRTLKSLGDNEMLVFNIRLTRCDKCGIPSTLELSVKNSILKDLSAGRINKEAAIGKVIVKKGPNQ